ncbi:MAG: hypothetical protein ACFB5Z_00955 [Elainellaceae cyanobacterium]
MASKLINKRLTILGAGVIFLSGLVMGCGSDEPDAASSNPPASSEAAGNSEAAPQVDSASDPAQTAEAAPQAATGQPVDGAVEGRNVLCSTPSQIAQVTWEADKPRFTLTRKPDESVLDRATPVAIKEEGDSVTYGYLQDATAYLKTFDSGNCMVQTLDAQGNVILEEYGRTS